MDFNNEVTNTPDGYESKREQQERMLKEAFFPEGELTQQEQDALEDEFDFEMLQLPTLKKSQKIYKGEPIDH